MDASLYTAASGMAARMRSMDLLANDLANAQTAGYRAEKPFFEELQAAGTRSVRLAGSYSSQAQGQLRQTGAELDLAIEGDGYLVVQTPRGELYTRNGQLHLDAQGVLSSSGGFPVLGEDGPVQVTSGPLTIGTDGSVNDGAGAVGKLRIVRFAPGTEPMREGGGLLRAPGGQPLEAAPEARLQQGFLEGSNVTSVQSMVEMIQTMRFFESNARAVKALDSIDQRAANEIGRANP